VAAQTIAVAAATMPLAAGVVGIIPALRLLQRVTPPPGGAEGLNGLEGAGRQLAWCFGVCFLGVFIAVPLRRRAIVDDPLPFPSGLATAAAIASLHGTPPPPVGDGRRKRAAPGGAPPPLPVHPPVAEAPATGLATTVGVAFAISGAYALASFFVPVLANLPLATWLGGSGVTAWGWTLTPAPSYVGQGAIMGLHTTLSMLAGAVVGWGIIGPSAATAGWVSSPMGWPDGGKAFIMWIALAIMIAEAVAGLGVVMTPLVVAACRRIQAAVRRRGHTAASELPSASLLHARSPATPPPPSLSDASPAAAAATMPSCDADDAVERQPLTAPPPPPPPPPPPSMLPPLPELPRLWWMSGLVVSAGVAFAVLLPLVHLTIGEVAVALLLSLPIAAVAVRALGETDLNPVSGLGKIVQGVFAVVSPGNVVGNVLAGAVAEAGAQQAGDLLQDLKPGYLLRVSPRVQFAGQLLGSAASAFIAVAAFAVFDTAFGVPSPSLPAPTAAIWVAMAQLANGGSLPPQVIPFCAVAAVLAAGAAIHESVMASREAAAAAGGDSPTAAAAGAVPPARRRRWWHMAGAACGALAPSPTAFAIGMYVTPNWTLPRVAGALASAAWARASPRTHRHHMIMVATGLVLGEGLLSLLTAGLAAGGVPPATCAGCAPGLCGNACPSSS